MQRTRFFVAIRSNEGESVRAHYIVNHLTRPGIEGDCGEQPERVGDPCPAAVDVSASCLAVSRNGNKVLKLIFKGTGVEAKTTAPGRVVEHLTVQHDEAPAHAPTLLSGYRADDGRLQKERAQGRVLCPRMKAFSDAVQGLAPYPLLRHKVSPCCGPLDDIHEDCAVATAASTWW